VAWRLIRPRHLVVAVLVGAAVAFAAMYPALAAVQMPDGWPGRYMELLPTWNGAFLFGNNPWPAPNTQLLSVPMAVWTAVTIVVTGIVVALASGWRPRRIRFSVRFRREDDY
jgi:hypothetical protein